MLKHFDPKAYLAEVAVQEDQDIDVAKVAIAFATFAHPGISVDRYFHHLEQIAVEAERVYHARLKAEEVDSAEVRLSVLQDVIADQYGYTGDVQHYDDLQNASLIRVIDRAKGLPITLAILYIHVGRAMGWDVEGLNLPGHFVCRIEYSGQRLVFDPFCDGKLLGAPELRGYVKQALGPHAELSAAYYEPASNREILVRLQNNIKYRKIDAEDYLGALEAVELMRAIDPNEHRLLLDAGVLYARTDQAKAAIEHLSRYIERAPDSRDRYEAEMLLRELSERLH